MQTAIDIIPNELKRIVCLPRRAPLDCEREKGSRRWSPRAQAFVELLTAQYTRGPRLSCGCQDRHVTATAGGGLTVFHTAPFNGAPPPTLFTNVADFCRDNAHDADVCRIVSDLKPGYSITLKGLGRPCITTLNPVQAWTLYELPRAEGIFGMVSIGGGKTACGILAPLAASGCRTAVIFVKPDQRLHYRINYLRLREHFRVPSIIFDDDNAQGSYIVPGTPALHVVPYSLLSNQKSTTLLEQLNPDFITADEAHLLANRRSSRTMRFLRYMAKRGDVKLCVWSGSLINKSLKDAAHLSAHSLGMGSPYPIDPDEVEAWSAVIDPTPLPDRASNLAQNLLKEFGLHNGHDIRKGLQNRLVHTPGVISTVSASVNVSIAMHEREPGKIPEAVKLALAEVRGSWVRPDGEELVEAMDQIECAREVAAGYYSYWAFPKGEPEELILEWYAARKLWNKELRQKLQHGEPHLDSPALCENAADRAWRSPKYDGDLPVWPAKAWPAWAKVKDLVKPDPRTKWIDDYLARDAAAWAIEHKGIVWCQSVAFGKRVAELAGINYHGGGKNAEANIKAEDGSRAIVASIRAHSEGRDELQFRFCEQLIAEPMSSAKSWDQLLGRLAREGQSADSIETWIYLHVGENKDALRKAIMYAEFDEAMSPTRSLLLAADMDFPL